MDERVLDAEADPLVSGQLPDLAQTFGRIGCGLQGNLDRTARL